MKVREQRTPVPGGPSGRRAAVSFSAGRSAATLFFSAGRSAATLFFSGLLVSVVACGARSETVAEEELTEIDCAAESQRTQEDCLGECTDAPPPTFTLAPQPLAMRDEPSASCVAACIDEATRQCEATATCRCSLALTKLARAALRECCSEVTPTRRPLD